MAFYYIRVADFIEYNILSLRDRSRIRNPGRDRSGGASIRGLRNTAAYLPLPVVSDIAIRRAGTLPYFKFTTSP